MTKAYSLNLRERVVRCVERVWIDTGLDADRRVSPLIYFN
jgi:hypothetical protein